MKYKFILFNLKKKILHANVHFPLIFLHTSQISQISHLCSSYDALFDTVYAYLVH